MVFKHESDVELIDCMGDDYRIVSAARVSTRGEHSNIGSVMPEEARGLLGYLMKHRHGTPFEHGALTFFIRAPIFVWREFHRHRIGFSYNEESARYKQLEPVFYLPLMERPMRKVDNWKPGRPKFTLLDSEDDYNNLVSNLMNACSNSYKMYEANLKLGIDPGLARDCLPVGIFSSCWVTCNPRSLMHFLSLRVGSDDATFRSYPLYEIEQVALKMESLFRRRWPITHSLFEENGRVAP